MIATAEVLAGLFVYFCGVQYTYAYRKRRFQFKSNYYSDDDTVTLSHAFTIYAALVWPVWWFARLTDFAAWLEERQYQRQQDRLRIAEEEAIERKRILAELDDELAAEEGIVKVRRK